MMTTLPEGAGTTNDESRRHQGGNERKDVKIVDE